MSTSGGAHGRGRRGERLRLPGVAFLGFQSPLVSSPGLGLSRAQSGASVQSPRPAAWSPGEHQASLSPSAHRVQSTWLPATWASAEREGPPARSQAGAAREGAPLFRGFRIRAPASQWPCLYTYLASVRFPGVTDRSASSHITQTVLGMLVPSRPPSIWGTDWERATLQFLAELYTCPPMLLSLPFTPFLLNNDQVVNESSRL